MYAAVEYQCDTLKYRERDREIYLPLKTISITQKENTINVKWRAVREA